MDGPTLDRIRLFTPDITGEFFRRPNKFIVEALTNDGIIRAHCPNPGRLYEILLPGTPLIFELKRGATKRKTQYTLVAAVHHGNIVPLDAQRTNMIAEKLIIPRLYGAEVDVRREVTLPETDSGAGIRRRSRVDFIVTKGRRRIALEVKSCTLCEYGVAMFPDAPTSRGTRHVRELSYLRNGDTAITDACLVLVVGRAGANVFIPNIHTDPEFSLSLNEAADLITIHAVNLSTDPDGYAKVEKMEVPINFAPVEFLRSNCGVYLLIIKLNAPREIPTGAIGRLWYRSGFYVYVGSAKRGLSHRIHRHAKRKKPLRWHIDYLTAEADVVTAFPIYTNLDLECQLADAIRRTAAHCIPRFGCSDCKCDSHLFRYTSNPLNNRAFVETLFLFRHKSAFAGLSTRPWLDPDVL